MEILRLEDSTGERGWSKKAAAQLQAALAFDSHEGHRNSGGATEQKHFADIERLATCTDAEQRARVIADVLLQIDALQEEMSRRHIRDLERLTVRITESRTCRCPSLTRLLDRFTAFSTALRTWQIRDRYLLMPTVRERLSAASDGRDYIEAYPGEFADLVREATMDQRDLCDAADRLHAEMLAVKDGSCCPELVAGFATRMEEFVRRLKLQFHLEQAVLQASEV